MYLGAMGDEPTAHLLAGLLERAGVRPPVAVEAPPGVEVAVREGGDRRVAFLLNYTSEPQSVRLGFRARDLLSGGSVEGSLDLPPFGVHVLEVVD